MSALPYVLGGGAALGLLLIMTGTGHADENKPVPGKLQPINPIPGGGGKRKPPNPPPGSGEATVVPNSQGGIITRTEPSTRGGESTKVAKDGDSRLAYNGETVAVIETGIKEIGAAAGAPNEWWRVMTPGGLTGFSRAVDGQGVRNFNLVRAPQGSPNTPVASTANPFAGANAQGTAQVSGLDPYAAQRAFRPFGMGDQTGAKGSSAIRAAQKRRLDPNKILNAPTAHLAMLIRQRQGARTGQLSPEVSPQPQLMTCTSPNGSWLRSSPQAQGSVVVEPGSQVLVDEYLPGPKTEATSPGHGGFARVRYLAPGATQPVAGYVKSEWLA